MTELSVRNDEQSVDEILSAIWRNFWIVLVVSFVTTFAGALYVLYGATEEYEARIRFELNEENTSGSGLSELEGLSALSGLGLGSEGGEAAKLEDRILSRPFLERIYVRAGIEDDPYLNVFKADEDLFDKLLKLVFGEGEYIVPTKTQIVSVAVAELSKRMNLLIGENGIIELRVAHPDPSRASDLANIIVEQSLSDLFDRERKEARGTVEYFASELVQMRESLDLLYSSLREFSVANNPQSVEELALVSKQLQELRTSSNENNEINSALGSLLETSPEAFVADVFLIAHPIASSVQFRRLMNWPSQRSEWAIPSREDLDEIAQNVRTQQLQVERIRERLEERASILGQQASGLASIEREIAVQEALYQSFLAQFETEVIYAGLDRASGRIIEEAIPPSEPSKPRKVLSVAASALVGIFVGVLLVLSVKRRRGNFFSYTDLVRAHDIESHAVLSRQSLKLRNVNMVVKRRHLNKMLVNLPQDPQLLAVIPTAHSGTGLKFSSSLAIALTPNSQKTAILDLQRKSDFGPSPEHEFAKKNGLKANTEYSGIDIFQNEKDLLNEEKGTIQETLEALNEAYDLVIVLYPSPDLNLTPILHLPSNLDFITVLSERVLTKRTTVDLVNDRVSKQLPAETILAVV